MHTTNIKTLSAALILLTSTSTANPLLTARSIWHSSSLRSSLHDLQARILPAALVIGAVDALPVLVEGGAFTGAAMDSMFGEVATSKPWVEKENCRVEITASKNKYDWGRCWMKVWGKGKTGGVGKDGGGGRVVMDEECPSSPGSRGNGRGDTDADIGTWTLVWDQTGHKCTDGGTSGWVCKPQLTFSGHHFKNGSKVSLELDVVANGDNGHTNGNGKTGLCNIGRQGTSGGFKDGYDDYECAVPCKEDEDLPGDD